MGEWSICVLINMCDIAFIPLLMSTQLQFMRVVPPVVHRIMFEIPYKLDMLDQCWVINGATSETLTQH